MATSSVNACIFYYPRGAPLRVVDLGLRLTSIAYKSVRALSEHEAISGNSTTIVWNTRMVVRITCLQITNLAVVDELQAVVNHLRMGGSIAVAEQGNKTLGAYLRAIPTRGSAGANFGTQLYSGYGGSWTPTAGERLLLRGPGPRALLESHRVTGGSATGANFGSTIINEWKTEEWIYAHNDGFWAGLTLPKGSRNADLLEGPDRLDFSLDLTLEEAPGFLERQATAPSTPLLGETTSTSGPKLDDYISITPGASGIGSRNPKTAPQQRPGGPIRSRWF